MNVNRQSIDELQDDTDYLELYKNVESYENQSLAISFDFNNVKFQGKGIWIPHLPTQEEISDEYCKISDIEMKFLEPNSEEDSELYRVAECSETKDNNLNEVLDSKETKRLTEIDKLVERISVVSKYNKGANS